MIIKRCISRVVLLSLEMGNVAIIRQTKCDDFNVE